MEARRPKRQRNRWFSRRNIIVAVSAVILTVVAPVVFAPAYAYGPQCDPGNRGPLLADYSGCTPCERAQDLAKTYADGAVMFGAVAAAGAFIPFLQPAAAVSALASAGMAIANRYYTSQAQNLCD